MSKFIKLASMYHLIRLSLIIKKDGPVSSMSITDILLILLGVIILILLLTGIYWTLRTYGTKIKEYFQRKFCRSAKPAATTHEIAETPILVSPNVNQVEDVEISLKSSRINNSNVPQKFIKRNEYESESGFESNLDFGTSPINLKDPPIGHPTF